jgi:hypothetical protein
MGDLGIAIVEAAPMTADYYAASWVETEKQHPSDWI